jgi:nitrogen fixation/metabolism regulation signal transduction histidine kinase
MGVPTRATRHAGGLYRKTFDTVLTPVRKIESEAHHLHEVEQVGVGGETPFVAILGVFLFLVPIFAVMLGLAFAAYYLVG